MGKLERQDAALVEMQLVFVRLGDMQHFHVTVLHPHRQPLAGWAVAQRKDLRLKQLRVMAPTEDALPCTERHYFFWGYYLNCEEVQMIGIV